MLKCYIFRGIYPGGRFLYIKYFYSQEAAQKFCDYIAPAKHGNDNYYYTIGK